MTGYCVVKVRADRLGRPRVAYFAGVDMADGGCRWARSVETAKVLRGGEPQALRWAGVVRATDPDARVSVCRVG